MQINLNIKEQESLYYFYHNWDSDQKNKIHTGDCKQCNYGTGKRKIQKRGKSGVWIGPFSSVELCLTYISEKLKLNPVKPCNCCN